MRPTPLTTLVTLSVLALGPLHTRGDAQALDDEGGSAKKATCWSSRSRAQYLGLGYNHMVEITNACDKPLACTVRTDVNPEPTEARVAPHQTETVVTFRGSPASEFKADVQCKPVS